MKTLRILFVHQSFPSQFQLLAPALAELGHEVRSLSANVPEHPSPKGVIQDLYNVLRPSSHSVHPWAADTETKMIRGEAVLRAAIRLRDAGYFPDVIYAHSGWGEALYLKDAWPFSRLIVLPEFFYHPTGYDSTFDPEFPPTAGDPSRIASRNATTLLSMERADDLLVPTQFQKKVLPSAYHSKVSVIHDGIDTFWHSPSFGGFLTMPNSTVLRHGQEIVTFINRNLEPYRGYHTFLRSLPDLLIRRPAAHVVIVGGPLTSYGSKPKPADSSYRDQYWNEVSSLVDTTRVHFLGNVSRSAIRNILRISSSHVYLTYPFVLGWSPLEAMSTGCLLIASDTEPVREVVQHQHNGLLFPFFSPAALAATVADYRADTIQLRQAARDTILREYDFKRVCLPKHLNLLHDKDPHA